uniref:Uncharacterized protein n=1 Tax=Anguilla anguilla TaxID=7936 RepID=A0A0E9UI28_ANGAN
MIQTHFNLYTFLMRNMKKR